MIRAAWQHPRWWAVVALVLAGHVGFTRWLGDRLDDHRLALDARPAAAMQRLQAAYVRELRPTAPAVRPARPVRAAAPRRPAPAPTPASAPPEAPLLVAAAASEPELAASEPVSEPPAVAAAEAPAASEPTEAEAPPDTFAWPASTRIRYTLTGQYRGEVHGSAEVQWIREGERYQVHLLAVIGPGFAPLGSRRMSSAGRTTAAGLRPERYEQETRMLLSEPRQLQMTFDALAITLANGTRVLRPPDAQDAQDTASQFVQLVWLFRSQPQRLAVGQRVSFTLAFPRRVQPWTYDVVDRTLVSTPAGDVEAFHVKPPRDATGGDWTTEMWFAPALQYLPVRLLIRQDAQVYVDMVMQGLPEQAAR